MNRNQQPFEHEYGSGPWQPSPVGIWIQREPSRVTSPRTADRRSGSHHGPVDQTLDGPSGYLAEQVGTQWSSHPHQYDAAEGSVSSSYDHSSNYGSSSNPFIASYPNYASNPAEGGGNYDFGSHFKTGMGMGGGSATTEETRTRGIKFEKHEMPTEEELMFRCGKYNKYAWQRGLKLADLERIYLKIGAHWSGMPMATFINSWSTLNSVLNNSPAITKQVVAGNSDAIQYVATHTQPETTQLTRVATPRVIMTMAQYLQSNRGNGNRNPKRPAMVEEPRIDRDGKIIPSWSPMGWDRALEKRLVDTLQQFWKVRRISVEGRLETYGRAAVTKYGLTIIGKNVEEAKQAAKDIYLNPVYGTAPPNMESEDNPPIKLDLGWAPVQLTFEKQARIVERLANIWRMDEEKVIAFLHKIGQVMVGKYAKGILSKYKVQVNEAAKQLAAQGGLYMKQAEEGSHKRPSWTPDHLDEKDLEELIKRLKDFWNSNNYEEVIVELQAIGKKAVAEHTEAILGKSWKKAETAALSLRAELIYEQQGESSSMMKFSNTHQLHGQQDQYDTP